SDTQTPQIPQQPQRLPVLPVLHIQRTLARFTTDASLIESVASGTAVAASTAHLNSTPQSTLMNGPLPLPQRVEETSSVPNTSSTADASQSDPSSSPSSSPSYASRKRKRTP